MRLKKYQEVNSNKYYLAIVSGCKNNWVWLMSSQIGCWFGTLSITLGWESFI